MHRLLSVFVLLGLLAGWSWTALAHTEQPFDLDPRLEGYPELAIAVYDDRIEVPAEVSAGRALVLHENNTARISHIFIARIPDEVTEEEVAAGLELARQTVPMTTPDWLFQGVMVGDPDHPGFEGGQVAGLVDLTPGRYLVLDPFFPASPARFEVTDAAATPAPMAAPEVDLTVELFEMAFTLPESVSAGSQLWEVKNAGTTFHEMVIMPVPDGVTVSDVIAVLEADESGAPPPAEVGPAWAGWVYEPVDGVGVLSAGGTVWAQFDLEPGTYAAVCFVPGPSGPHFMLGMIQIFTVADGAATPSAAATLRGSLPRNFRPLGLPHGIPGRYF